VRPALLLVGTVLACLGFGEGVRLAAARQGTSVSAWLTEAAADKLRNELLGAALDQWEAEDGPFTETELDEAASRLGLAPRSDVA
jgi:hypothetical protein